MASMPDFNALLLGGYNTGREMKRQEGERSAMTDLVNGNPGALGSLATYNPQAAYQVKIQQDQRQAQIEKLKQEKLAEGQKLVGQAALVVAQYPDDASRAQAWDQQIDALVQQGWTGMAQYKGKYSRAALESVIAQSGNANEYRQGQQPRIVTPQPGGGAFGIGPSGEVSTLIAPNPGDKPFGAPVEAPKPKIIPQRPPNLSDADLIAQAREAIRQGAPATEVFQQLQAWGVNP